MSLVDSTPELQKTISEACSRGVPVKLEKGDYAVQSIGVPKNSKLTLFSKDRVRILYIGKRNRPLFVLDEHSSLIIEEKIEIYYNTNNIQELNRLMIRRPETSSVEISKGVKISLFSLKQ